MNIAFTSLSLQKPNSLIKLVHYIFCDIFEKKLQNQKNREKLYVKIEFKMYIKQNLL